MSAVLLDRAIVTTCIRQTKSLIDYFLAGDCVGRRNLAQYIVPARDRLLCHENDVVGTKLEPCRKDQADRIDRIEMQSGELRGIDRGAA